MQRMVTFNLLLTICQVGKYSAGNKTHFVGTLYRSKFDFGVEAYFHVKKTADAINCAACLTDSQLKAQLKNFTPKYLIVCDLLTVSAIITLRSVQVFSSN